MHLIVTTIAILGYVISKEGFKPNPDIADIAIKNFIPNMQDGSRFPITNYLNNVWTNYLEGK